MPASNRELKYFTKGHVAQSYTFQKTVIIDFTPAALSLDTGHRPTCD